MPVRSLHSSVLRWPDADTVLRAARSWAGALIADDIEVVAVGCFGSYARGDAGVGSDLDLIVLVRESDLPFARRRASWPTETLPVPVDLLVYTVAEWHRGHHGGGRFFRALAAEIVWLAGSPPT